MPATLVSLNLATSVWIGRRIPLSPRILAEQTRFGARMEVTLHGTDLATERKATRSERRPVSSSSILALRQHQSHPDVSFS